MTVTAEILRELHRIHRQLSDLRSRLARGPKQIAAGNRQVAEAEATRDEAKEATKKARMAADQRELQLKEREARIAGLQTKLNQSASNREYQALKEQIAADEQANSVLSDEIIDSLDKIEQLQRQVAEAEASIVAAKQELTETEVRVAKQKTQLEGEIARLEAELKQVETRLTGDVRGDYARLVSVRGGEDAMAPLDDGCCGGCFHTLTPQNLEIVLAGEAALCNSCGQIVYLPEQRTR